MPALRRGGGSFPVERRSKALPQKKISLRIDGELVNALEGQTILDAARASGKSIPTLCFLEGLSPVGACRLCMVGALRRRPAVSRLHHSGPGRHVGDHHLSPAVALSPHDRRAAAGGAQSRLRGLRGQWTLRVAGHGVHHGHHQRALRLQLPAPAGGCLASPLRARPQPLHPVHALRSHLRRDRRSACVGDGGARHSRPHRFRPEPEVGRRQHLHQLRQVRAGVPHRRSGRKGQSGGGDGAIHGGHYHSGPPGEEPSV